MHKEITIIGPGLIGASLGLELKKNKKYVKKLLVLIYQKIRDASSINAIDEKRQKIDKRVKKSSVIFFICNSVSLIDNIVNKLSEYTEKNQIISDVGSVKNIFEKKTLNLMTKIFSWFLVIL